MQQVKDLAEQESLADVYDLVKPVTLILWICTAQLAILLDSV